MIQPVLHLGNLAKTLNNPQKSMEKSREFFGNVQKSVKCLNSTVWKSSDSLENAVNMDTQKSHT